MNKKTIITVKDTNITILAHNQDDYISLTDMAKGFDGGLALIEQWLRNKDTIEFLGIWERINNNQDFNSIEFEGIKIGLLIRSQAPRYRTFNHTIFSYDLLNFHSSPQSPIYLQSPDRFQSDHHLQKTGRQNGQTKHR